MNKDVERLDLYTMPIHAPNTERAIQRYSGSLHMEPLKLHFSSTDGLAVDTDAIGAKVLPCIIYIYVVK
jgi:hypothetical protein